jgi:hypothetical protein
METDRKHYNVIKHRSIIFDNKLNHVSDTEFIWWKIRSMIWKLNFITKNSIIFDIVKELSKEFSEII